jgi:hypothetical protein
MLRGRTKARANTGWAKNRARDAEIVRRYGEGEVLTSALTNSASADSLPT